MADAISMDRLPHHEPIGQFLLRRLAELGLSHVFGVAGDFNLELLEQLGKRVAKAHC